MDCPNFFPFNMLLGHCEVVVSHIIKSSMGFLRILTVDGHVGRGLLFFLVRKSRRFFFQGNIVLQRCLEALVIKDSTSR